jgi:hypothetical protein
MLASRPAVTQTTAWLGSRPVAKAFMAWSSMTYTRGVGRPAAMQRFSTTLYSCGLDCRLTGLASEMASVMRSLK